MSKRKLMARNLKNLIIPVNEIAAESLRRAAKDVAPTAGLGDVYKKKEVEWKVAAKKEVDKPYNKNVSVEMELVAQFLREEKNNARTASAVENDNASTPAKRRKVVRTVTPQTRGVKVDDDVTLPLPKNGKEYTKPEAAKILSQTKFATTQRAKVMRKMIELKWAPVAIKTLQNMMKKHDAGELILDNGWNGNGHNGGGRKRAMQDTDIDDLVDKWERGEAHGSDSINKAIQEASDNMVIRSGGVPISNIATVGRTCQANIKAMIAAHRGTSIVNKATGKTPHRIVSERSKRRLACKIGQVGSTHFISVPNEDPDIRNYMKDAPEEIRIMYDAVTDARGTSVVPVKPHNLWSIDDTTFYTFQGKAPTKDKVNLVTKESVKASGSESIFRLDDSNSMSGLRVSMTVAISGVGTCLPVVACVSGLTDRELPDTDFLVALQFP